MDQTLQTSITEIVEILVKPIVGEYKLEIIREGDQWRIDIQGENAVKLLGSKGEVLNAVQHILRVLVHNQVPKDRTHFIMDVNQIRSRREKFIAEEIPMMAKNEVLAVGMTVIIKNLSSYERRLIHQLLAEANGIETMSVGEGTNRKLLIRPTSDTGSLGIDNSKIVDIDAIEKISLD